MASHDSRKLDSEHMFPNVRPCCIENWGLDPDLVRDHCCSAALFLHGRTADLLGAATPRTNLCLDHQKLRLSGPSASLRAPPRCRGRRRCAPRAPATLRRQLELLPWTSCGPATRRRRGSLWEALHCRRGHPVPVPPRAHQLGLLVRAEVDLGFGRILVSETEVPNNMLANMV